MLQEHPQMRSGRLSSGRRDKYEKEHFEEEMKSLKIE
jgi:hypothetical protein